MERRSTDRRQCAACMRWPERRTGFDRRDSSGVEALRDSSALLLVALALLNLLNLLDWRFTVLGLERGAIEANPLMSFLFGVDSYAAGLFKVAIMLTVSLVVWRARKYRHMLEFAVVVTTAYAVLIVYHLIGLGIILPNG